MLRVLREGISDEQALPIFPEAPATFLASSHPIEKKLATGPCPGQMAGTVLMPSERLQGHTTWICASARHFAQRLSS
jgi:hypothetical protein